MSERRAARSWRSEPAGPGDEADLGDLLTHVARGDQRAFERVYDEVSGPVYGLALRIVRDPAQSEEVAQEVLVDVWRTASRYEPGRGSAMSWVMMLAHRRAVDRVRSAQAAAPTPSGSRSASPTTPVTPTARSRNC
jgi:RNA polymerase sigma-70 factor, ECF subfamily